MKRLLLGLIVLLLLGCAPQQNGTGAQSVDSSMPKLASLPDLGPAPELTNDIWLNGLLSNPNLSTNRDRRS